MLEDVARTTAAQAVLILWFSLAAVGACGGEELGPARPTEVSSRWMGVDGVDVHYRVAGKPAESSLPPLLLLHGWLGSSYEYVPVMGTLSDGLSSIAPDLPGHGLSQKAGIVFDTDYYMEFLSDFLAELGIPRVVLVGSSMGGGIAVHFAVTHPRMVERLILLDPDGLRGEEGFLGFIRQIGPLIDLGMRLTNRFTIRFFSKLQVFHDRSVVTKEYVDAVAANCLTPAGRSAQAQITKDVLGSAPVDDLLPKITKPTLVIWGEEDRLLQPKWAQEYLRRISDARLAIVAESGHIPHMEAPQTVAGLIEEFVLDGTAGVPHAQP